jgi:hypothetical protein
MINHLAIVRSCWLISGGITNPTLRRRVVDTCNRYVWYTRALRNHRD